MINFLLENKIFIKNLRKYNFRDLSVNYSHEEAFISEEQKLRKRKRARVLFLEARIFKNNTRRSSRIQKHS
jgi:hypothetical protein